MITFESFVLENGLKVAVHTDKSTPIVAFNLMYHVGSRDETEDKTGFAHLFEHLMFGGSVNIPDYDAHVDRVGGSNNAFTTPDFTNYYITLPKDNLETAFWLESDRMLSLAFDANSLEVQRKVVIEEFRERCLNQPYGDVWLKFRPFIYKKHPYRWEVIGKEISHIENAVMDDVKAFFFKFYRPNNAFLTIAGDVTLEEVRTLSEKWFGNIDKGAEIDRNYPIEERIEAHQKMVVYADVPTNVIYKAFLTCERNSQDYYAIDLLSDVLGRDKSARLQTKLVLQDELFTSVNAYITGTFNQGLLVIEGKVKDGVSVEQADEAITSVLEDLLKNGLEENELQKVKNQAEFAWTANHIQLLNRAMNLSYFSTLGSPDLINDEAKNIQAVKVEDVMRVAKKLFAEDFSYTMFYLAKEKE